MSAAHTPGPWLPNDDCREIVALENGFIVASIHGPDHRLTGKDRREGHACATANACLIAAAPDMLMAARNTIAYYAAVEPGRTCLVDQLNPCGGLQHWGHGIGCPLCSARAALAKVEGK